MKERAKDKGRLEDILEYSENVIMLINGHTLESFVNDKRTYYSVMKNIEVVGEAAYMLTKAFKKSHPATPWKTIEGMRHVLVHDYVKVVSTTLYDTAVNGIPELREQVEKYLVETNWDAWTSVPDDFEFTIDEKIAKTIQRMKADGMAVEQIARYTGLTEDEINNL